MCFDDTIGGQQPLLQIELGDNDTDGMHRGHL